MDIISVNKYEGWYIYTGQLDVIEHEIVRVIEAWRTKHNKPILMTEFGADTEEGLHLVSKNRKFECTAVVIYNNEVYLMKKPTRFCNGSIYFLL